MPLERKLGMGNELLIDTSILIGIQRNNTKLAKALSTYSTGNMWVSRITTCELIYGARNAKEKKINKNFLSNFEVIELDQEISILSFRLLDKYCLKNRFGIANALIASTAIVTNLTLWTLNIKHFNIISGLKLHNYLEK